MRWLYTVGGSMDEVLLDARMYVANWFAKHSKMHLNGVITGRAETGLPTLLLDYDDDYKVAYAKVRKYDDQGNKLKVSKRVNDKSLEYAFEEFVPNERERVRAALPHQLPYLGPDDQELKKWLVAVTGASQDLDLAVMKHFLWQIKRKLNKLKVTYHLVPVLFGKQGGGKSKAVKMLVSPVEDLMIEFAPIEAVDPRNAKTLNDNFVCLFDEMSSMQRVEMESLKRLISADWLTYRPMRSNDFKKVSQNTTFIGISNKSLQENIFDSTGLRRFAEITVLPKADWDAINAIDYSAVWACIDHTLEDGYTPAVIEELKAHQQEMTTSDEFQDFVLNNAVMPVAGQLTTEIAIIDLHRKYDFWRGVSGYGNRAALSINFFSGKLKTLGLYKKIRRIDGKDKVLYTVNANSEIFKDSFQTLKVAL